MSEESDRKLLELAAKAAGIGPILRIEDESVAVIGPAKMMRHWSPLTDDGDALRLVIRLQLEVSVFRDHVTAYHPTGWCDELHSDDPYAATRRAIVRAAASIGEGGDKA